MVVDYIGMCVLYDGGCPNKKGTCTAEASRYQTYKGTDYDGEHQNRRSIGGGDEGGHGADSASEG